MNDALFYPVVYLILFVIVSPIGLLIGRKAFKLTNLKIWHIWLALFFVLVVNTIVYILIPIPR